MKFIIYLSALIALAVANEDDGNNIFASANQQFTSKMFSEVTANNPGKSVVMSPFSVLSPLGMLALASEGESHDEILKTIGFPNDNVIREVFVNVTRQLKSVNGVQLNMAGRIFVNEIFELNDQFKTVSRDTFDSEATSTDFTKNVEAAAAINKWVEAQTNDRIKDLVQADSLSATTAAVLVNAIYFKGSWKNAFDKKATRDRDFYISEDKTVQIPMMYSNNHYRYGESTELDAQLLELPYEGDQSSLLLILPNKVNGLLPLLEKLKDNSSFQVALENMGSVNVDVILPKFKIETEINLKDVLSKIGVTKLFTPEARLNKLIKGSSDNLAVSEAVQKAFIEISEEGTEAAAANSFGVAYLSAAFIPVTQKFEANHPFVLMLYIERNPIFAGVFQN